jgi:hypothetical protein
MSNEGEYILTCKTSKTLHVRIKAVHQRRGRDPRAMAFIQSIRFTSEDGDPISGNTDHYRGNVRAAVDELIKRFGLEVIAMSVSGGQEISAAPEKNDDGEEE